MCIGFTSKSPWPYPVSASLISVKAPLDALYCEVASVSGKSNFLLNPILSRFSVNCSSPISSAACAKNMLSEYNNAFAIFFVPVYSVNVVIL